MRARLSLAVVVCGLAQLAAAAEPTPYERYVEVSMQAWGAPGVSVAIVKDGKVTLLRGFGVRALGRPEPVDARTVFPIASLTKGFTAAAVAALAEDGKLAWDDPVSLRVPGFRVADPQVSQAMTLRDLGAHRTGLSGLADNLWYRTSLTPEQLLARLAFLPQASPLRTGSAYQNVSFLVLGEAVARASGLPWKDYLTQRVLQRAGMSDVVTTHAQLAGRPNVASPHLERNGKQVAAALEPVTNIEPAAGLSASATDLSRWLRLFLGRGELDGQRVLSAASVDELTTPQFLIPFGPRTRAQFPDTHFMAYGLGWLTQDYRGKKVLSSTGGLDGMTCSIALVPEAGFGVVVLTNYGRTGFPEALVWRAVDDALGPTGKDWSAIKLELSLAARAFEAKQPAEVERTRQKGTQPSLPLAAYAGTYHQDLLGDLQLTVEGKGMKASLNGWSGAVEHWHRDTFRIDWGDPQLGKTRVTFALTHGGDAVRALAMEDGGDFTRTAR